MERLESILLVLAFYQNGGFIKWVVAHCWANYSFAVGGGQIESEWSFPR